MPVVPHDNPRQLLGLLRRTDLFRAYDASLTRRAAMRSRIQQFQLGPFQSSDMRVDELLIEPGSMAANKNVNEVNWSSDCIVVRIRRGSHMIIPYGNTLIKPSDVLVIVSESPVMTSCIS